MQAVFAGGGGIYVAMVTVLVVLGLIGLYVRRIGQHVRALRATLTHADYTGAVVRSPSIERRLDRDADHRGGPQSPAIETRDR
jgi:hypothetical protein